MSESMSNGLRQWQHVRETFQTLGLLGRPEGTKTIVPAYWSEVHSPNHIAKNSRSSQVTYLDSTKRQKHTAKFNGNKLIIAMKYQFEISITRNVNGEIIYIVDGENNFYVGRKKISEFHHSSFLAGGPAKGAGTLILGEDFKILEINNHSGHYQPGLAELKNTALAVALHGGDLSIIQFRLKGSSGVADIVFGNGQSLLEHT